MQYIDTILRLVIKLALAVYIFYAVREMRRDNIKFYSIWLESDGKSISYMRVASTIALIVWYKTANSLINVISAGSFSNSGNAWISLQVAVFSISGFLALGPKLLQKFFEKLDIGLINRSSSHSNNNGGDSYDET